MKHRSAILFLSGFAAMLAFGWAGFPRLLYARRAQPVSFSLARPRDLKATKLRSSRRNALSIP